MVDMEEADAMVSAMGTVLNTEETRRRNSNTLRRNCISPSRRNRLLLR
jgi:hypothetical protein